MRADEAGDVVGGLVLTAERRSPCDLVVFVNANAAELYAFRQDARASYLVIRPGRVRLPVAQETGTGA